jgi:diphosphomevalonate decarboxylase
MKATAIAHPNIALVKYWGKRDSNLNIPAVGSISITLDTLSTTTTVVFDDRLDADRFSLDGRSDPNRVTRVEHCLGLFRDRLGVTTFADVRSDNNFPTAAGLASSASGFAALVTAADSALDAGLDRAALADLARRCSGSAARSVYGGFAEINVDERDGRPAASTRQLLEPGEWPLKVVIAITQTGDKDVGSTRGMDLTARTSPYYSGWVESSESDLDEARNAIRARNFDALADVSEHSCLKMHGVMMASRPGLLYWNAATIECLHRIRTLRARGTAVFFTVDAGPQVKAVCLPDDCDRVAAELRRVEGVESVLVAGLGHGAQVIEDR